MLTAWDNLSESVDYEKKIDGFITKPIDFDKLFSEIELFLPSKKQKCVQKRTLR
jgi:DNA-binding response OmpR family regulator